MVIPLVFVIEVLNIIERKKDSSIQSKLCNKKECTQVNRN